MAHIDKYKGKEHLLTPLKRPKPVKGIQPSKQKGVKNAWPAAKNYTILRDCLAFVQENLGEELVGVEIGVYEGDNSEVMFSKLPMSKLYLIDPYQSTKKSNETQITPKELQDVKRRARKRSQAYYPPGKYIWIHKHSCYAVHEVEDNVDFVYMDGDHSYEGTLGDLTMYYPKVRKGGVIGGHDFWKKSVVDAVREFKERHGLYLYYFNMRGQTSYAEVNLDHMDWWFVKER